MTQPDDELKGIRESAPRFWTKVRKTDSCWEWTAATIRKGYGSFKAASFNLAHRYSWTLHFGVIPPGLLVCHRCNNKCCVNPDHLYLATNQQNIVDAFRDGLVKSYRPTHCKYGHEFTPENTMHVDTKNRHHRRCRICQRRTNREWKRKKKG